MHTVLIARRYVTTRNTLEVSLLQDTVTFARMWEVRVLFHTRKHGVRVGAITRRKTRTAAMAIVRRALYDTP